MLTQSKMENYLNFGMDAKAIDVNYNKHVIHSSIWNPKCHKHPSKRTLLNQITVKTRKIIGKIISI